MNDGVRHFISVADWSADELRAILARSRELRRLPHRGERPQTLRGRTLAMYFEKPSLRTHVTFEAGMSQLGGHAIFLRPEQVGIGTRESPVDVARNLSRWVDGLMARTFSHALVEQLARASTIPVINGLTDRTHPCQLMGDVMTFEEHLGAIAGRTIAWCGDGNNMATSWIQAAVRFGFELRLACPEPLSPPQDVLDWAAREGVRILVTPDMAEALSGADCVVTDVWVSMQDDDKRPEYRHNLLRSYQIDDAAMALAKPGAIFMHCLPAHRGEEVAASVIDGPQSVVWDEAENRLHAQKGILLWCMT